MTSNQDMITAFLDAKGLTDAQIAGVLGNLKVESGFSPTAYNPGEKAIGIAQWEGPRRTALQAFAAKTGGSETSLGTQLRFMWAELNGSESRAFAKLKATSTPAAAAAAWDQYYERSSGEARTQRQRYAVEIAADLDGDLLKGGFLPDLGPVGDALDRVGGAAKGAAGSLLDKGKDAVDTVTDIPGEAAGKVAEALGQGLLAVVTAPVVRDTGTRVLAVLTGIGLLWIGLIRISAPAREKVRSNAKQAAAVALAPETGGASLAAAAK